MIRPPFKLQSKPVSIAFIFLIVLGVLLFRRYDAFMNPQLWAEDGPIFLLQSQEYGVKSLFMPYNGYMLLLPRLVALTFTILHIDLLYIPLCYNVSTFLITLLTAYYLWQNAVYLNLKNKILYATVFLILPVGAEIFMNLTNSIWFSGLVLINFLFVGYQRGNKYVNLFFVLLFSLTGPYSLILAPVVLLIFIVERKRITIVSALPLLMILACGFIQFLCLKHYGSVHRDFIYPPQRFHLIRLFMNNIKEQLFLTSATRTNNVLSVFVLFALLMFLAISYSKIIFERKYVLVLGAILLLASFIIAYWPNESAITALTIPRYYFLPYACITLIIIVAWDKKINFLHVGIYICFFLWHREQEKSVYPDKEWKRQVLESKQGKRHSININPGDWKYVLPKDNFR